MYHALALLETPISNPKEALKKAIEKICSKLNSSFTYVMQKNYSHKEKGGVSVYCFLVHVGGFDGFDFNVDYYNALTLFDLSNVKDLPCRNFTCCIGIISAKPNPFMDYFNDFVLLCENIEKELNCVVANF